MGTIGYFHPITHPTWTSIRTPSILLHSIAIFLANAQLPKKSKLANLTYAKPNAILV